jgi:hypothetical protein
VSRDHRDDHVTISDGFGNAGCALASGRDEAFHRAGRAIEADDGMAGINQALGHRTAHDAETDER